VRSLGKQLGVSPGFDAHNVLRARFAFPTSYSPEGRLQLLDRLRSELTALPSVRGVTFASDMPLAGGSSAAIIHVVDVNQSVRYYRHYVDPAYFTTLRVPLVAGRVFTPNDRAGMPLVAVINHATALRFWTGQDPVGRTIRLGSDSAPPVTIVGVVADVRQRDLTTTLATSEPDVYFPLAQRPAANIEIALRTDRSPDALAAPVRQSLSAIDRTIPLYGVQSMESLLARQTAEGRFASTVLSVFGVAALLLSAIGLYGVLAFLVTLRRREIGIRIALGATHQRVSREVINQGVRLALIGAVAGLIAAALLTRWISSQLFGVSAHDPIVFAGVSLALIAVATLASWVPARRAANVDPQIALRAE
jgi:putative ABC transport system permease protein